MLRFPAFYHEDPEVWLIQVECAFAAAEIRDPVDKYCHFIANIDKDLLDLFADVIKSQASAPAYEGMECAYENLKSSIVEKYYKLGEEKFTKLFKDNPKTQKYGATDKVTAPIVIKLPRFSMSNPELWFEKIEATFSLAKITSEEDKCLQFMANLEAPVLPLIRDMLPITSITDVKQRILCRLESDYRNSEQTDSTEQSYSSSKSSVEDRLLNLEEKMEAYFVPTISSLEASIAIINEKINSDVLTMLLEKHVEETEKRLNESASINDILKHCITVMDKQSNDAARNVDLEERMALLEDKMHTFAAKDCLEKHMVMSKKKMDKFLSLHMSVCKIVKELNEKIDESSTNVTIDKHLVTLEKKSEESASQETLDDYIFELKKKVDQLMSFNMSLDQNIGELTMKVKNLTAYYDSLGVCVETLEKKINDSVSKAHLQKIVQLLEKQIEGAIDANAFLEHYLLNFEKTMKKETLAAT